MTSDQVDSSIQKLDVQEDIQDETLYQTITSCRWTLSYVGCICFTLIFALRINMGIAIVCMVKAPNTTMDNSSTENLGGLAENECAAVNNTAASASPINGDIEWDKKTQGWVLSSFFYGYIFTQIPGGWLSGRFGGKRVMLVGLLLYGICTVTLPVAARYDGKNYKLSAILVIILLVITGLATGVVFPAMHNLLGRWSPPLERTKLATLCFSGNLVGNVIMLGTGGFFCEWTSFDGGWPSMFYVGGGICLLFCLVWMFTVYDTPEEHPRISERELHFIQRSLGSKNRGRNMYVPWRAIITSPAMWAIIFAHFCDNFGNYTLMTKLPAFMKEVLKFDIKSNGLYSTLPYIAMVVVAYPVSHFMDKLREKRIISTITARKTAMIIDFFTSTPLLRLTHLDAPKPYSNIRSFVALVIPAGFLVATGQITCEMNYLGVIFLTLAKGFTGFNRSGYHTNPQDIASRYAGEVFAISNVFATIPGIIAPLLINAMTPNGTAKEWQRVFYVWASIYVFGAIMFTILARGETQDWALVKKNQPDQQTRISVSSLSGEQISGKLEATKDW